MKSIDSNKTFHALNGIGPCQWDVRRELEKRRETRERIARRMARQLKREGITA